MRRDALPGLSRWLWRAFLQSALIPLLLVEFSLIAVYLLSNSAIRDAQVGYLRETALADLQRAAETQAQLIEEKLERVARTTDLYRNITAQALNSTPAQAAEALAITPEGMRYSAKDTGGPASFYSSATSAQRHDLHKVARLARADGIMQQIKHQNPLVTSVYFNGWDNYNRIYPWLDAATTYPHDLVTSQFSFYYLADAKHNPSRDVVWTEVYLDPAAQGWMLSAVAPVYRKDFLEGVCGIDITVAGLLDQIQRLQVPWNGYAMLVSNTFNIMALPAPGEHDFGLTELTTHAYEQAITDETFKPDEFNLGKRELTRSLANAIASSPEGVLSMPLGGRDQLIAWSTVGPTGWHLLTVVDEADVFQQTDALAQRYERIGLLLIAGLIVFYLLFASFMWWRSRRLSQTLLVPIAGISRMMDEIGQGRFHPERPRSDLRELQVMIDETAVMGEKLAQGEAGLVKANEEAQASSRAKSRFISSISHELRTPLNAIQGFAQVLQMEQRDVPPKGSDLLGEIISATRHLNQLLGDILEWSGAQNERRRITLTPVAVRGLLHECCELVRLDLNARGLELHLDLPEQDCIVRGDAQRMRQILLNLLSNAIKYNRAGGRVVLGYEVMTDCARLWVADTGIGIDPKLHQWLFEPFQRLGQENSSIPGTGIGLSLCREYTRQMNGCMGFQSTPGVGSCFWVELSLAGVEPSGAGDSLTQLRTVAGRDLPRVMYVEDDRASQMIVSKALERIARVEVSGDGLEALHKAVAQPPRLILMDLNIPGLRGDELLQRLRNHPNTASVPIVMLTAALEEEFERLSRLDCQGLLRKPVEFNELNDLVASLLKGE
jgi:signal transduction histidine kinase